MDKRTKEIIGIAASIAAHCQPCFLYHLKEAKKLQISSEDIRETIEIAKAINRSGDENMIKFAEQHLKRG